MGVLRKKEERTETVTVRVPSRIKVELDRLREETGSTRFDLNATLSDAVVRVAKQIREELRRVSNGASRANGLAESEGGAAWGAAFIGRAAAVVMEEGRVVTTMWEGRRKNARVVGQDKGNVVSHHATSLFLHRIREILRHGGTILFDHTVWCVPHRVVRDDRAPRATSAPRPQRRGPSASQHHFWLLVRRRLALAACFLARESLSCESR